VVYRATDTVLDRTVALKSLPAELLANQDLVRRFQREAKLLAALTHPNIVGVYDLVSQDGQLYMAMELVRGRDLSALLEERGRLSEAEAVDIALQCARALSHAHGEGIIHRDFKPDNVLLTADGTAKVTDFGIAKSQSGPRMTQTGALMGTPYYMSPEQSSGSEVDARTDLYALGATLYELLSGGPPFVGNTGQILIQHISEEPAPLQERAPDVSAELTALVHALFEKDREQRPRDMNEVVARLDQLVARQAASA
jgi:serine/threonine-protein kinase